MVNGMKWLVNDSRMCDFQKAKGLAIPHKSQKAPKARKTPENARLWVFEWHLRFWQRVFANPSNALGMCLDGRLVTMRVL